MCFRADAFRALDLLSLGPTCRVRKIFTMRGALDDQDTQDESGASAAGARACNISQGGTQVYKGTVYITLSDIFFSSRFLSSSSSLYCRQDMPIVDFVNMFHTTQFSVR